LFGTHGVPLTIDRPRHAAGYDALTMNGKRSLTEKGKWRLTIPTELLI
jgi:hypothetical protein